MSGRTNDYCFDLLYCAYRTSARISPFISRDVSMIVVHRFHCASRFKAVRRNGNRNDSVACLFFCRYIELFPSTYEEAKRIIMNDARSNAKQFVGEKDEQDKTTTKNLNTNNNDVLANASSRSGSRHRSRSTGRSK